MILDQNHLAALSAVLRYGSFDAAAQALSVTPSAISQRIKALEDHTGAAVVIRGHPCEGTALGKRLAKYNDDVSILENKLLRDIGLHQQTATSRLRIAVNADSLTTWFMSALAQIDGILFDLVVDDQSHSADWLKRGEVAAAVTLGTSGDRPVSGCDQYPLGSETYIATASPDFVTRWFPQGVTRATLRHAPVLVFNNKDTLQHAWAAQLLGNSSSIHLPYQHYTPSTAAFTQATLLGIGWGMQPFSLVKDMLDRQDLVPLAPDLPLMIPLNWQVSRILAPALTNVTKAVQAAAKSGLYPH